MIKQENTVERILVVDPGFGRVGWGLVEKKNGDERNRNTGK